jgi:hypothetical protein
VSELVNEFLTEQIADYVNRGGPSQAVRELRAERLVQFLTDRGSHVPSKFVLWWLVIAFLLGANWRLFLASFRP